MSEQSESPELIDEAPDASTTESVQDGAVDEAAEPAGGEEGLDVTEPATQNEAPRENPLLAEGDIAADYLEELLDIADLDGDIENYTESGRAHVVIDTDGDQLVGKNGEVLEALQELARLAVMTETGHRSRLMLDIAGYRDRRRTELQALAKDAIADVLAEGEAVRLRPMNAFERKIVHDAVAAAGLVSESEGEEPRRLVVVKPAE